MISPHRAVPGRALVVSICAALALACTLSLRASAQAIAGRVIDAAGTGLAQAEVTVVGPGVRLPVETDSAGRFFVALPAAGRYWVQARRLGYEDGERRDVSPRASDTAHVTLRLRAAVLRLNGVTAAVRGRRIPVRGVFKVAPQPPSPSDHVVVEVGEHGLVARGKMPTPSFCYRLAGGAVRSGQVLALVVEARPNGDLCGPSAGTGFTYRMTVKHLQPGTYTLRVFHTLRDAAADQAVALDTTIVIQ